MDGGPEARDYGDEDADGYDYEWEVSELAGPVDRVLSAPEGYKVDVVDGGCAESGAAELVGYACAGWAAERLAGVYRGGGADGDEADG